MPVPGVSCFLIDTRNLGEQAEQEFMAFVPNDDNRKFTELYNVQRLTSGTIAREQKTARADGRVIESGEDPRSVLAQFRNDYHPRIAVTVDMDA